MRVHRWVPLLLLAGCATTNPAVDRGVKLRPDTRPECAARCDELGMRLGAIVLIQNSAGCVCEPADAASPTSSRATGPRAMGGAVAVAGGAIIAAQAQREADERAAAERARREDEERRRRDDEERQRQEDEQRARDAAQRQNAP